MSYTNHLKFNDEAFTLVASMQRRAGLAQSHLVNDMNLLIINDFLRTATRIHTMHELHNAVVEIKKHTPSQLPKFMATVSHHLRKNYFAIYYWIMHPPMPTSAERIQSWNHLNSFQTLPHTPPLHLLHPDTFSTATKDPLPYHEPYSVVHNHENMHVKKQDPPHNLVRGRTFTFVKGPIVTKTQRTPKQFKQFVYSTPTQSDLPDLAHFSQNPSFQAHPPTVINTTDTNYPLQNKHVYMYTLHRFAQGIDTIPSDIDAFVRIRAYFNETDCYIDYPYVNLRFFTNDTVLSEARFSRTEFLAFLDPQHTDDYGTWFHAYISTLSDAEYQQIFLPPENPPPFRIVAHTPNPSFETHMNLLWSFMFAFIKNAVNA